MSDIKKEGYSLTVSYNGITYYIGKGCDCVLPIASETTLGGIKVGLNLHIDENGVLSATDTTYDDATEEKSGLMSASDKTKLDNLPNDAEPNQNAFSKVIAGSDAIESTTETDTFSLEGSNITITGSPASKKITFALSKQGVINALGYTPVQTDTNTSHYHGVGVGLIGDGSDGISGGTFTYKLNLQSETLDVNNALVRPTSNANRFYPLLVDKSGHLATIVPWTDTTYTLPTMTASAKGGAKLGTYLKVENDTLDIDTTKIATIDSISGKVDEDTFNTYINKTAPSTYAKKVDLDNKVNKAGDAMTGTLVVPIVQTGTDANNYFQSQKFRGQGDAATYYHAVDFGYSGHNQVDFYEYGGVFNFWKNTIATATTDAANKVISFQLGKLVERGNTLTYPGKSGTIALTSDLTDFITKEVNNLENYYTAESIDSLVATIKKNAYQVATDKPTTGEEGITYLIGSTAPYEMWIYETTEGWIYLGKSTADLSGYVTGQDLTSNMLILGSGGTGIKSSGISIVTALGNDNSTIATSLAVKNAIDSSINALSKTISGTYALKTDIVTYTTATTTANGLMSSADKSKLDGIESGANKYVLPVATSDNLGGAKIGYSENGKNYAVKLDSDNKMYVNVPWTDTNTTYTFTPNNPTLAWGTTSTIGTIGGQTFKITMPSNPNTDTHWTTMAYIGAKGSKSNAATTNGNTYLKVYDNSTIRSQFQIKGSGATSVISDSSGNVEIKTPIDNQTITSGSNGLESHPVKISVDNSSRLITLNIL